MIPARHRVESVIQALSARGLQAGFEAWFHRD